MISYKIAVSGRVQGVFFRDHARQKAQSLGLKGYVRNMPEGAVEALFQGPEEKVKEMINWCKKGPVLAKVSSIKVQRVNPKEKYKGFKIIS